MGSQGCQKRRLLREGLLKGQWRWGWPHFGLGEGNGVPEGRSRGRKGHQPTTPLLGQEGWRDVTGKRPPGPIPCRSFKVKTRTLNCTQKQTASQGSTCNMGRILHPRKVLDRYSSRADPSRTPDSNPLWSRDAIKSFGRGRKELRASAPTNHHQNVP